MKTSSDPEIHDGNSEVQSEKTSFAIPAILWFVCASVQTSDSLCAKRFRNLFFSSSFVSVRFSKVLAYDSLPAALEASTSLGGALRAVAARAVFVGFLLAARDGVRGKTRENQGKTGERREKFGTYVGMGWRRNNEEI